MLRCYRHSGDLPNKSYVAHPLITDPFAEQPVAGIGPGFYARFTRGGFARKPREHIVHSSSAVID